eukprot:GHVT01091839.1.p1 GENE.GHVT01091839.1~~GHVT01091839.1.p1  ORF type:complete len:124 (+),score=17.53 GHVT01091839.1:920-1291(+)
MGGAEPYNDKDAQCHSSKKGTAGPRTTRIPIPVFKQQTSSRLPAGCFVGLAQTRDCGPALRNDSCRIHRWRRNGQRRRGRENELLWGRLHKLSNGAKWQMGDCRLEQFLRRIKVVGSFLLGRH